MAFSTILILMFMVMFWLFRAIVALCTQFSIDLIGITAYNLTFEIVIAFITIICIILIAKRKIIGSLAYLLIYGMYFGEHLFSGLLQLINGGTLTIEASTNLVCDFIAILLAIFCLIDILIDKKGRQNIKESDTDWYFKNKQYDEELKKKDSRDDKNEYKFY